MQFTIEDLTATDDARIEDAARLLHAAFSPLGVGSDDLPEKHHWKRLGAETRSDRE